MKSPAVTSVMALISTLTLDEMRELRDAMRRQWGEEEDEGGAGVREPRRPLLPSGVSTEEKDEFLDISKPITGE